MVFLWLYDCPLSIFELWSSILAEELAMNFYCFRPAVLIIRGLYVLVVLLGFDYLFMNFKNAFFYYWISYTVFSGFLENAP